jgi:hypothetical protein
VSEPVLKIRFYRPRDWLGRLVCWATRSEFAHCNIEVDEVILNIPSMGVGGWFDPDIFDATVHPDEIIEIMPIGWSWRRGVEFELNRWSIPWGENIMFWLLGGATPLNCASLTAAVLRSLGLPLGHVFTPDDLMDQLHTISPSRPSVRIDSSIVHRVTFST